MGYPLIIRVKTRTFAEALIDWYVHQRRNLPWRRTSDPYRIWVSEIMLQQTRVETVRPYYERFLTKYPNVAALAQAREQDLLAMWAGLGYYSRARLMQRAAKQVMEAGGTFPATHDEILRLPGIGDYTAAAIASIAYGLPHAVLDGNVMRVVSRLEDDAGDIRSTATRKRLHAAASNLLDRRDPGSFNQALMELGAMICVPDSPKCLLCPVESFCRARALGRERELPVKSRTAVRKFEEVRLLIVHKDECILLWQRPHDSKKLAGFWELPEPSSIPSARIKASLGAFQHGITNTSYTVTVLTAEIRRKPSRFEWVNLDELASIPLSTTARKAIQLWNLAADVKSL